MSAAKATGKKNLLLCLDAFGTLFTPSVPIPVAYARAAARYGINCGDKDRAKVVGLSFKQAFKEESRRNPNYGKATGLGAEKWWGNVIRNTFKDFLNPGKEVPQALITELLKRYSTKEGYDLYGDVHPFFEMLRNGSTHDTSRATWIWDKTIVGIITNSDDRVPGILESFGLKIGPRRVGTADQRSAEACSRDDIDFVVLSYDVGFEKPDRRIFDAATEMLKETLAGNQQGLSTQDFEKLYVGDDLEKDYDGAEAAGWDRVLLNRDTPNYEAENNWELKHAEITDRNGGQRSVLMAKSLGALRRWGADKNG
ncbi:Nn.00g089520.m01.CDS01 [Neocucurbitaria sp. VM-36]